MMSGLSQFNPTSRFTGLSELYARCRPDYPAAALDFIISQVRLGPGSILVDVGCGTGISSRLFAQRGLRVMGVEPNADMRARAEAEPIPPGSPPPCYREGRAEATNLPDTIANAVLAAQAFHWFEPAAALQEFHRILKPGGWVILMWNERDLSEPFTAAYSAIVDSTPEAVAINYPHGRAGEPLLASPLFQGAQRVLSPHEQRLNEESMLGRAFSVSHAPREPEQAGQFAAALRDVFGRFQQNREVILRYQTIVYLAQRPGYTTPSANL
jgi:SAM-dependent methyltransferase